MTNIILVTGAASSGKSEWAESLAKNQSKAVVYIATAQKIESDQEWIKKIVIHQQRRPNHWKNWEVPLNLADSISKCDSNHCLLIDSLGTWVANWLEEDDTLWQQEVNKLLLSLDSSKSDLIFVAEETGWGVIPAYKSGRLFRNRLGNLVRKLGQRANTVYLIVGGYAVDISKIGEVVDT